MRKSFLIVAILTYLNAASLECRATLIPITASQFAPGAQTITFETGSTGLPTIPGVTFLSTSPGSSPFFGSDATFDSFGPSFGSQCWANLVSTSFSELGLDFASPVQAIGGYVAKIPNFENTSPANVVVQLFDSSQNSLGTATITLNPTLNSPVFFGFAASEPIAGVAITGNNAGFFGVDNLTYGNRVSVAEPSSLVLAGAAALAGLGVWRHRRCGR